MSVTYGGGGEREWGAVYRRGQLWSIAWIQNGAIATLYEHGLPGEDTARWVLAVRIGDLAAGRSGLKPPKPAGPLTQLVEAWLKDRRKHASLGQSRPNGAAADGDGRPL